MAGIGHALGFGGSPAAPAAPAPPPVVAMPSVNGPEVQQAADLRRRQLMASGGRASTNLTGPDASVAAPTYLNSSLGS